MLANLTKKLTSVAAICAIALSPGLTLPVLAETEETSTSTEEVSPSAEPTTPYEKAQAELSEHLYVLYRIVERLARANDLDDHPWRVVVVDEDEINAYATEANLVIVYFGLLDQMAGDASALACVVGHEMAHNIHQHAAIRTSKMNEWQEQHKDEDYSPEEYSEFEEEVAKLSQTQELEADTIGYHYAATAGFEASGCLRGLNILSRLPESLIDSSSHPAVPRRVEALEERMAENPPESLKKQGQRRLEASEPLTFEMLDEDRWLRINSERGGSFVEDLDRLFPES